MKKEDKQLLLKDLCARVPYHPKGHVVNACTGAKCDEWLTCATFPMFTNIINNSRLYLRPMSSMTEEEYNSIKQMLSNCAHGYQMDYKGFHFRGFQTYSIELLDWLNTYHFDYRNLIERGLAIEVTEENNPYK